MFQTPIAELVNQINQGRLSISDLLTACYANIEAHNPQLNALITVRPFKEVLAEAEQLSKSKESLPLKGIPYVMKDSYVTKSVLTTCASALLKDFIPPYSATVYQRLRHAGALLIGKANMDAWGHGASTENNDYGPAKNPYHPKHIAGGSSGGSAVAVAADFCLFAIGEDTGGSIRNPAAWNNITGLKVTYGRVSRYGCIAYASSFDTVGPMAKSVADIALLLSVMAGRDPLDATSSEHVVDDYVHQHQQTPPSLKLGVAREIFQAGLDPVIKTHFETNLAKFKQLGHQLVPLSIPMLQYGLAIYYLIGPSETSSNLARYDGIRYGQNRKYFTQETMRRIMTGTYALSSGYYDAYYRQAQLGRALLIQEFNQAFKQADVLLFPVNPTMPPHFGQMVNNPLTNMLADLYTINQNIVGIPSLALPGGFDNHGLPIGFQICGPMFSEANLLSLGNQYQQATTHHLKKPPLKPLTISHKP